MKLTMRFFILTLWNICLSLTCAAQISTDLHLSPADQVQINNDQVMLIQANQKISAGHLSKWVKGQRLYSWTFHSVNVAESSIDASALQTIIDKSDPNNNRGGGIYVSSNPTDSSNFGNNCEVFELKDDFLFFIPDQTLLKFTFSEWNALNNKLKAAGISATAVQVFNPNWFVVFEASVLVSVHKAMRSEVVPENSKLIYSQTEETSLNRAFPQDPLLGQLSVATNYWMNLSKLGLFTGISQDDFFHFFSQATQPMLDEWFSQLQTEDPPQFLINAWVRSQRFSGAACYKLSQIKAIEATCTRP